MWMEGNRTDCFRLHCSLTPKRIFMKPNRTGRILAQGLILFVLSLFITLGWDRASVATQPAELVANDRFAQINVRTQPSTAATLAGFAYSGDRIEILNQTQRGGSTWYQMQSNRSGIVGWVRGDFIKLRTVPAPPKIQSPSAIVPNPSTPQSANCATVYPVSIPVINQGFGQVSDPADLGSTHFHTGVDFDGRIGDPINSPICGTVFYVGREQDGTNYEWGYGWHIKIRDNQGRVHLFAHISKAYVKVGETVIPGQLIASIGNNGNSTGPHLHYEIRQGGDDHQNAINPMLFLAHAGQGGVSQAGTPVMAPRSPLRF